ncbi:MAG: DUF362 domain-containing protein [Christensenellales bacterium]|jgi:uncharacterized protein (DUF362 family)/NAD-dependent dihydropyrimidine dehydrogenase PreA subunit
MVSIVPCADYSHENCLRALREAVDAVGGLDWVAPGMKIAVKVNLISMLKPDAAATTHPALVSALVELIAQKSARAVVGDSPGGPFNAAYLNRVYQATGMRAVEAVGGLLNADFSHAQADFPTGKRLKRFSYTAWLEDCDGIINFSKLKTHGMMGMTAAVKNMLGAIPGMRKPELHYEFPDARDFADMLIDINEYLKPRLSIVDAVVGMEGNGPTMGTPRNIGCVIAGKSPYAVDLVCARIIGITEAGAPTLAAARDRALAPEAFDVLGDIAPFLTPDFTLPPRHDVRFLPGTPLAPVLAALMQSRPALVARACIGCERCREVCPAGAITMRNKRPVIRRGACIRCFCCQELCPVGALVVKRPAFARLVGKL